MSQENLEARVAKLEPLCNNLAKFSARLLALIHKSEKYTLHNLGELGEAIKDPANFDLEDYRKQLRLGECEHDQMDAQLRDLNPPLPPPPGS